MTTASNARPTKRVVESAHFKDQFIVEIGLHFINIRPKGSRRGGRAEITVTPGSLYQVLFEMRRHHADVVRLAKRGKRKETAK